MFRWPAGKAAADDLKLSALELKPNFKLMMVGSLEADIEGVANAQFDNRDIIDDFDDENNDDKTANNFHKMDVSLLQIHIRKTLFPCASPAAVHASFYFSLDFWFHYKCQFLNHV